MKNRNEGKRTNAFISILRDRALSKADDVDQNLAQSRVGKLAGLIIAIKDRNAIKGEKTTYGSRILSNFISHFDATVIQRMENTSASIINKTNLDEVVDYRSGKTKLFGNFIGPVMAKTTGHGNPPPGDTLLQERFAAS